MIKLFDSAKEIKSLFKNFESKGILIDQKAFVLVRSGEHWFLTASECPHSGASLKNAHINEQFEIVCPMHAYAFDLFTGNESKGRCNDLKVYRVKEMNGELWADI